MGTLATRRIGIVGGMGPAAGHYFAQRLTELTPATSDQEHPFIIHISNPRIPDRTVYLMTGENNPVPEITATIKELERLQVDVICIPCNTAHAPKLFAQFCNAAEVPILNMVDETLATIAVSFPATQTICVLGTTGTRVAGSYQAAALPLHMQAITPSPERQKQLMKLIYDIKRRGVTNHDTELLLAIAKSTPADLYVVGCTELSMLTSDFRSRIGAPVVDSLDVLANRALSYVPLLQPMQRPLKLRRVSVPFFNWRLRRLDNVSS